jgi:hypothetical protein
MPCSHRPSTPSPNASPPSNPSAATSTRRSKGAPSPSSAPSRQGWGRSRANLNLNQSYLRRPCRLWRFEAKLQSFLAICQRFCLRFPLACDIQLEALRDEPVSFPPNAGRKWTFHGFTLSPNSGWGRLGHDKPGSIELSCFRPDGRPHRNKSSFSGGGGDAGRRCFFAVGEAAR